MRRKAFEGGPAQALNFMKQTHTETIKLTRLLRCRALMAAPEMISYRQRYTFRHLYRRWLHDKRGATAALFAVLLVPLVGFAGLGVDLGIFYTLKRQMQSAVDNGALSGAMELSAGKGAA